MSSSEYTASSLYYDKEAKHEEIVINSEKENKYTNETEELGVIMDAKLT